MRNYKPKVCDVCGKPFTPTSGIQKRCGSACQLVFSVEKMRRWAVAHKSPKQPRACAICCGEFIPQKGLRLRYCGKDCNRLGKNLLASIRHATNRPSRIRHCAFCGCEFRWRAHNQTFCSKACRVQKYSQEVSRLWHSDAGYRKKQRHQHRNWVAKKWINDPEYMQRRVRESTTSVNRMRAAVRQWEKFFEVMKLNHFMGRMFDVYTAAEDRGLGIPSALEGAG